MLREEAVSLVETLCDAYEKRLSDKATAFYIARLTERDKKFMTQAVDRALDTCQAFPRWARVLEHYNAIVKDHSESVKRLQSRHERDDSMTPAEMQAAAESMAERAVEMLQNNGGQENVWTRLLQRGAEIFSENAKRRVRGEKELPVPRVDEVLRPLGVHWGPSARQWPKKELTPNSEQS